MSRTIWKFELKSEDEQVIHMPDNAKILCVDTQKGTPCLWALVEANIPSRDFAILTFRAGHDVDLDNEFKYVGTYQLFDGNFVEHVFIA